MKKILSCILLILMINSQAVSIYAGSPNPNALIESTTMASHPNELVMGNGSVLSWLTMSQASSMIASSSPRSFINNASHSIISESNAANGFLLSSTRDTIVNYSVSIATVATIGGASGGTVVLEICPTNSASGANWIIISRVINSQSISLAVVLQSVDIVGMQLMGVIPAGYYVRLRSITSFGSPAYTYLSGQEVGL